MTELYSMRAGQPYPLGPTWDGRGVHFSVFSAHATRVEICIFDETGEHERARMPLPTRCDDVFCGYLEGAELGLKYGLRVHGPYEPRQGHRFNPNKLLIDPYAKLLSGSLTWDDALFGYQVGEDDLSFDTRDSAPFMPKCVVTHPDSLPSSSRRLTQRPLSEGVIYEGHVKGLTYLHPDVPSNLRGTVGGLGSEAFVDHMRSIGVTALELLPIQSFVHDRGLIDRDLSNYWGYQPLSYFAPMPDYLGTNRLQELSSTTRALADQGIEVLMDVVYNHTGEGNEWGPTLSFRGIDNASYYALKPEQPRDYLDDSGCGNRLNVAHPRVLQLVMDSLRYWHKEMGVSGFRFDLCTSLGRGPRGLDMRGAFFAAVRQDPTLATARMIAEPWDLGPGGYQLGAYPNGWSEWNDRYRDTVRRFWRGDSGLRPELAKRICGSSALYRPRGRSPSSSINYLCSHDGVTLHDLVTYGHKRNHANGEENRDGHHDDLNCHQGVDGESPDPELNSMRRRIQRSLLTTLFLSRGGIMLLAGDEMGRTQRGNNNAYCQDNDLSWIEWGDRETRDEELLQFTRRLSALRRDIPLLSMNRWATGERIEGSLARDLIWLTPQGEELSGDAWAHGTGNDLCFALTHQRDSLWIVMNAQNQPLEITPPKQLDGVTLLDASWSLEIDTVSSRKYDVLLPASRDLNSSGDTHTYWSEPRSVQIWKLILA